MSRLSFAEAVQRVDRHALRDELHAPGCSLRNYEREPATMTTPPAPFFRALLKAAEASVASSPEQRSPLPDAQPPAGAGGSTMKSRWVFWSWVAIAVAVLW